MGTPQHQHIDSSGAFDCPFGPACKYPRAGQQFDVIHGALTAIAEMKVDDDSDFMKVAALCIGVAQSALKAQGSPKPALTNNSHGNRNSDL